MTPEEFARDYLIHIFHRVTAAVALDAGGAILSTKLFDTEFGGAFLRVAPDAAEVWLLSNHEDGGHELYVGDHVNIARVRSAAPDAHLQVFITNEDWGCVPVDAACWGAQG
ncbi:MAG: hypothetical protein ACI4PG_04900 [Candidatus Ventricola sp.]